MLNTEAYAQFQEQYVLPLAQEALMNLESDCWSRKEVYIAGVIDTLKQLCELEARRQAYDADRKLGYISFSILRTEILTGRDVYRTEAQDKRWLLDSDPIVCEYDASWAIRHWHTLCKQVMACLPEFQGSVTLPDAERMLRKEIGKFHKYVVHLIRHAMREASHLTELMQLRKEDTFEVRVGEYLDLSESVYKEDRRPRKSQQVKEWLEEKEEMDYLYEAFEGLDLSRGDYREIDARYTRFFDCDLSKSTFHQSLLIGSTWNQCLLDEVNFSESFIQDASFSGCSLKLANFQGSVGSSGILMDENNQWVMPGFWAADFTWADLEDADFREADLRGADFRGANVIGAKFDGALLEGAIFSREAYFQAKLDEHQRNAVVWHAEWRMNR